MASHSAVRNALHLLALRNSGLRHVLQLHADISTAIVSANDYRFLDGDRLGTPSPGKQGAANTLRGDNRSAVPIDYERLALLRAAAAKSGDSSNPLEELDIAVRAEAIVLLGGEAQIGRLVTSEETLVEAIAIGLPAEVLGALRKAGYPPAVLEQVIAPRRTLMRRKAEGQRLTRAESDAAWRLAYALALASHVFDGRKAALAWLSRPKAAMGNRAPIELIETSVGAAYVERMLRSIDWGDTA